MTRYYTDQELCNAIYCAVFNSPEPLTRLGICKSIHRAKSPHIVGMIKGLAAAGWLTEREGLTKHKRMSYLYEIGRYIEAEEPAIELDKA